MHYARALFKYMQKKQRSSSVWSSVDQKEESAIYGEEKQVKAIHSSYISCELQKNLEQRGCRELLACSMVTNKDREGRRQRREKKNHAA